MNNKFDKCIPVNGLKINTDLSIPIAIEDNLSSEKFYNVLKLYSYEHYLMNNTIFINKDDIKPCDTIIMYSSQRHNTTEVINVKILISALYFADRMSSDSKTQENIVRRIKSDYSAIGYDISDDQAIELSSKMEYQFFKNYNIPGYFDENREIKNTYWYITLGNRKLTKDDFERSLTRGFSEGLCEEYSRQANMIFEKTFLEIDDTFIEKLKMILIRINDEDEYSKKIKSALRLYYNVLYEDNIEQAILTYTTILETLLLKKQESKGQKKRVANRAACIVGYDTQKSQKIFIANIVAYFYTYRNKIVHEGMSFLELDEEWILNKLKIYIRHIIFYIFQYVVNNDIKSISKIEELVLNNLLKDKIISSKKEKTNGYITYSNDENSKIQMIYDED